MKAQLLALLASLSLGGERRSPSGLDDRRQRAAGL